jgi:hypothetical protein
VLLVVLLAVFGGVVERWVELDFSGGMSVLDKVVLAVVVFV